MFMVLTFIEGNYESFFFSFSQYLKSLIDLNMGSHGGTANIETIYYLIPSSLKHVCCIHCKSVPYAVLKVLKTVDLNLEGYFFHITP